MGPIPHTIYMEQVLNPKQIPHFTCAAELISSPVGISAVKMVHGVAEILFGISNTCIIWNVPKQGLLIPAKEGHRDELGAGRVWCEGASLE